ncbi:MAG: ATP-binding protein [Robiginitomaculum sp.]|nr:MAG: ATP-binding protein [Robiginitomaculum sp.]
MNARFQSGQGGAGKAVEGRSLVWRLVRSAALWVVPAFLVTAISLILFYRTSTYKIFDDPLINTIQSLIAYVETDPQSGEIILIRAPIDPSYQRALSGRYWLIGELKEDGRLESIMGSPSLYGASLVLPLSDAQKVRAHQGDVVRSIAEGPDKEPLRLAAQSVIFPGMGDRPVVIVAAADRRPTEQAVRQFSLLALGLMSVLALGLSAAIFMQVRLGLRPLFDLRGRVVDVRQGRASSVEGEYPKEIKPLADELNSLIGHNRDVVEYARTHVGNLAHALKTPLAVLVNEAGDKDNAFSKLVTRQAEEMLKQVDHHLRRARAATRGQSIGETTPVLETISSLARTLPRIHRDKDLDIQLSVDKVFVFRGAKRDLEEMVGNLMDNACKWTGSKIRVSAEPVEGEEGQLRLIVDDDGPGLDADQYVTVLKRGERLDEATPGSGFGLSIVNDLALAYKGSLQLDVSPLGGLRAILIVPIVVRP